MTESGAAAGGARRALRSQAWFSGRNMFTFAHRSWNGRGYPPDVFDGRPVIGICNSWSELTTCNAHLRIVAEHVKQNHRFAVRATERVVGGNRGVVIEVDRRRRGRATTASRARTERPRRARPSTVRRPS